jgi:hypothetical protein
MRMQANLIRRRRMTFHEMVLDWFHPVPAELLAGMEARVQSLEQRLLAAEQKLETAQPQPTGQ